VGWIPDDGGNIWAHLGSIQDCAAALVRELETYYTPYRELVNRDMIVAGSAPDERFAELCLLLERHRSSRVLTTALLTEHGNATRSLALAAETVSRRYAESDGAAAARATTLLPRQPGDPS